LVYPESGSSDRWRRGRALANLDILERENLTQNAAEVGGYLQMQLHAAFDTHPLVGEVRGAGMLAALEFMADKDGRKPFDAPLKVGPKVSADKTKKKMRLGVFWF
jgi:L-2,4-diaminobutyrate transaminase